MSISNLVFPDKNAPVRLLKELTGFFAQFSCVNRIFTFGSMARGDWDRWSDIDMLVVTQAGFGQQWQIFDNLRQFKPILHHHAFIAMKPSGGFIPGITFENESVFHMLDLNFISLAEYQAPQALERFGPTRELIASDKSLLGIDDIVLPRPTVENPDEQRISKGIHWTKKAVKKVLRGSGSMDELTTTFTRLQEIMQDYPQDKPMPGGNICHLARKYIENADISLANRQKRSSSNRNQL